MSRRDYEDSRRRTKRHGRWPGDHDRRDRNLDESRNSHQRGNDRQASSFGYGDDFSGGEKSAYRVSHPAERRGSAENSFEFPSFGFGAFSHGEDFPQYGDLEYPRAGSGPYSMRGKRSHSTGNSLFHRPNYSNNYRDWGWRDQPRRQSGEEGLWESTKRFFGIGPKNWKRSDDRIREDVCEALAAHPSVDASDMEVEVKNGIVFLKGTVENRYMKRQAEFAAEEVTGVEDVRNELQILRTSLEDGPPGGYSGEEPGDNPKMQ